MKKIILFSLLIPQFLFSQNWVDDMLNPENNFYETQKEFNDYWENKTIEKGKGWKQFKRWENFIEQRVFPDGIQHPEILFEEATRLQNSSSMMPPNIWTQVGPDNVPLYGTGQKRGIGRVNTIAFHPTNPNKIYVGAPAGGFWKSDNGGQTWTTTTDCKVGIGKTHPCFCELINVWGSNDGVAVNADILHRNIIGNNKNKIWFFRGEKPRKKK